ncbi:hypothetical protein BU23DRAFT_233403 [Bimuria novae-zelandiae CBS 107.79]|uniref:RING-type domain-containing protein n=1 Tax=Bimuria novae-zelandiae CBS 107.79 TaxID=1447943 RepID=A0A6A5V0K2_9PLEO|nr:hypothetical protein BU23DRAFT_233403 [Bimuria novae-zelandiae CBS 107.79]
MVHLPFLLLRLSIRTSLTMTPSLPPYTGYICHLCFSINPPVSREVGISYRPSCMEPFCGHLFCGHCARASRVTGERIRRCEDWLYRHLRGDFDLDTASESGGEHAGRKRITKLRSIQE